jgi:tetratricopeptide (TPR) repeat protein
MIDELNIWCHTLYVWIRGDDNVAGLPSWFEKQYTHSFCFSLHPFFPKADDVPVIDPKYEKNATTPGLANPAVLKLLPLRVSQLCKRSALLQRGNALAAMGKEEEAINSYESVFPLLEGEPRCSRIDWERHSLYVNIGNSHSRQGNYDAANEQYTIAEKVGQDHIEGGNVKDGKGMVASAKKARAFALKRAGRVEEAKKLLKEVVDQQIADAQEEKKKATEEEAKAKEEAEKAQTTADST